MSPEFLYVYMGRIEEDLEWEHNPPPQGGPTAYPMSKEDFIALVLAHELGHTMGLTHRPVDDNRGVMSSSYHWYERDFNYYARFDNPKYDEAPQRWQINLRKLLGRDGAEIKGNRFIAHPGFAGGAE